MSQGYGNRKRWEGVVLSFNRKNSHIKEVKMKKGRQVDYIEEEEDD